MNDFEMMCELTVRRIFQCERFKDPLGRLANSDSWSGLLDTEFSIKHKCMAWAVAARIKNEYLDGIAGREHLFEGLQEIDRLILNATSNEELVNAMKGIWRITEELNLKEFPHINYRNTNDV